MRTFVLENDHGVRFDAAFVQPPKTGRERYPEFHSWVTLTQPSCRAKRRTHITTKPLGLVLTKGFRLAEIRPS